MNLQTESTKEKLLNIISSFNTTPFLFIGSGITRRYCNLPSWDLLLEYFSNLLNPNNEFAYANYKRQANNDYSLLGSIIGEEFDNQWFSNQDLFEMSTTSKDFIKQGTSPFKCAIAEYLQGIMLHNSEYENEEQLLKEVLANNISGIITTNYDTFIEDMMPDFKTYVSQKDLLFSSLQQLGEIYKIHGSVSDPNTIVINKADYTKFDEQSKYLAAKLLTIFIEYPIIFMGYSLSDPNIRKIISDIAACLDTKALEKLSNRFIMITRAKDEDSDIKIQLNQYEVNQIHIPMINIELRNYGDLYEALQTLKPSVPIKLLRLYRESFYEHTLTTTKVKNILVNIDDTHIKPDDLVFTLSKPGSRSLLGLTGIDAKDWYLNVLYDTLEFTADDLLTYAYPKVYKANNKLPAYKLLTEATHSYPEIEANLNTGIPENAKTEDIDKLLNKTLIDTKYKRNYTNDTVQTIINTYPTDKEISEIQYLPQDNINIDELYTFLDTAYHEIPDVFSAPRISTAFKRLIRFYDWLKFGRS